MGGVLFVCLGNICRSPLADAAFREQAALVGLEIEIDSAGTGDWHIGHPPDPRAQRTARKYGVDISGYRARQVSAEDFRRFAHVVALDHKNLGNLQKLRPEDGTAELHLLLDFVPGREGEAVADPYFGDESGFEVTWREVNEGARGLLARIRGVDQG